MRRTIGLLLARIWARWKVIAHKIGDFQARFLLTLFYFVALCPFALLLRWKSDPLAIKARTPRGWRHRVDGEGTPMERATKQS